MPDREVGRYVHNDSSAVLLVGHSSGIFKGLKNLQVGDEIRLGDETYDVKYIETLLNDEIDMGNVLHPKHAAIPNGRKILVLMTCAGKRIHKKYSHRLIIYAAIQNPEIEFQDSFKLRI